ncbi:MAG: ABC transporter [Halieaceae bacterium]|jgi:ABC-type uncharacterized transport system involved in gliding motility auxiliary subunit|nr:ABC transporter [Halieaceae bacterium]
MRTTARNLYSNSGLLLLAGLFLLFNMLNNMIFSSVRIDLTENNLYTVSDGSKQIIESIDEPLSLYFFFSDQASEDLTSLRTYAKRVEELLEEYALHSNGKITLTVVDPEPFSEAEDQAAEYGLQSVPINNRGDELYFGLAATNALDQVETIGFFQPDKEEFLEYEISKLVYNLTNPIKPVIGLMTTLKMRGDIDRTTYQAIPSWMITDQIEQLFDVQNVEPTVSVIPESVSLLMVVHPKELDEGALKAIDQFVLGGGKLLLFVDPLAEIDRPQPNPAMPAQQASMSSDLNQLTEAWGLKLREGVILGDASTALTVGSPTGGAVRHLAIQAMASANFAQDDVITASLESVNVATAGILEPLTDHTTTIEPVLESSENAMPLPATQLQYLTDPAQLQQGFVPTGEKYLVGVRIAGPASTAFPQQSGADAEGKWITASDNISVLVFADVDMLTDRLWVSVQNFFGQRIASPFANNGDLVTNALDNLAGSSALISIRSRGRFTRPFDVVDRLRREAESRNLAQADELQIRLSETERKLTDLQQSRSETGVLTLSTEQEQALLEFQEEKLKVRKELREVRHQLDKDIEALGSWLKFINIALVPILLTLGLLIVQYFSLRTRKRNEWSRDR